jgi:hypothetical protein
VPSWLHELAAITTLTLAVVWLVVRWLRVGKPRVDQPGCSRCDRGDQGQEQGQGRGVRSARLRVID